MICLLNISAAVVVVLFLSSLFYDQRSQRVVPVHSHSPCPKVIFRILNGSSQKGNPIVSKDLYHAKIYSKKS